MTNEKTIVFFIFYFQFCLFKAQLIELPVKTDLYPFINYQKDSFIFCNESRKFDDLFYKLDTIILYGKGQLSIVHLGGSHIQADMYTNHMRTYMQQLCNDCNAGRGLITPYKIANSNNPANYSITYGGEWEHSSIVKPAPGFEYGISGLTLRTNSDSAFISIDPNINDSGRYAYNYVKIFHSPTANYYIKPLPDSLIYESLYDSISSYTQFYFENELNDLTLGFRRNDSIKDTLNIYGITLESDDPGIVYHTVGINGASLTSYLNAGLLFYQLKSLEPNLFIISVGTNDANTQGFNPEKFSEQYKIILDSITMKCPDAAILLTVPNDSWLFRKYVNYNTEKVRQEIFKLSCLYHCGVWDFYTVMGGLNSISLWYDYGMARPDRIHFNRKGYELQGNLFFNAFMRQYNNHIHYIEDINNKDL